MLVEPYACSVHAVNRGLIQLDDVVVLSGAGPLGLGMVGAARLKNPSKLIVLDTKQTTGSTWRRSSAPTS